MRWVEERALAVLERVPEWIWDGESVPVPVEDIADSSFGLLVRDADDLSDAPGAPQLDGQSLSGLLLPATGEIWVNAKEARAWPGRRRFTIGHELGHFCMHRHGRAAVFCRSAAVKEEAPEARLATASAEEEANVFAAALLMPDHVVRAEWSRLRFDLYSLCVAFGVSRAAMERRLAALGLETR